MDMTIDTLHFAQDAIKHKFTQEQAEFLAAEFNQLSNRKVEHDGLTDKFTNLESKIIIKLGALIIVWTTVSLAVLGFIIKT